VNELASTVREALAALTVADRKLTRFGAAHHGYVLAPPLAAAPADLPDDLRDFATMIGSGGAGPGYGWFPVERAVNHLLAPAPGVTAYTRALPISHLGCGYAIVLPLDGSARGEVWLDARAIGKVEPIHGTFTGCYLGWIDALANNAWPLDLIPPAMCSVPAALSGYFGMVERNLGIPENQLAGEQLRAALGDLGPGSIQIAGELEGSLFHKGEPVDPCLTCARLLDTLAADGLRRDAVVPGVTPLPGR
jgi:hypothetical protein